MKGIAYCLVSLLTAACLTAKAETQRAHIHGQAALTLAQENELLDIHFESPAENLVGFEHKAVSPSEVQAAEQTDATLKSPTDLFSFIGTDCILEEASVDMASIVDRGKGHGDSHHDSHANGHQNSHKDDHHDSHENHNSHSEMSVSYRFRCQQPKRLKAVSLKLFSQFPGIEKINVMWVTDTQQGSTLLNPDNTIISLR